MYKKGYGEGNNICIRLLENFWNISTDKIVWNSAKVGIGVRNMDWTSKRKTLSL